MFLKNLTHSILNALRSREGYCMMSTANNWKPYPVYSGVELFWEAPEQGNKEMVVFQTGFTGSTGCVISFNHIILLSWRINLNEAPCPSGNRLDKKRAAPAASPHARMALRGHEVHVIDRGAKYKCQGIFNGDNESLNLAIVHGTHIPGVPCVTLRDDTERPATVEVGSNILAGADPNRIVRRAHAYKRKRLEESVRRWEGREEDYGKGEEIWKKKLTVRHSSFNQPAPGFAQTRGSAALQAESHPDMDNMDLYNENTNYNINVDNFIK